MRGWKVLASAAVMVAGLLAVGCEEKPQPREDGPQGPPAGVRMQEDAAKVTDQGKKAAEDAATQAATQAEDAAKTMDKAADDAGKTMDKAADDAAKTMDEAADDAGKAVDDAAKETEEKAGEMKEEMEKKAEEGSSMLDKAAGAAVAAAAAYTNSVCPVGGEKLESGKAVSFTYEGKTIGFCCADCIPEFKKDPAKYLATMK